MRNNENRLLGNQGQNFSDGSEPIIAAAPNSLLNFVMSTEMVDLPSKGKFYPPSHPLHNKPYIEIKHMTAKEEDILSSRTLLQKGVALDKLIQSVVVDKSINTDSLVVSDRNAIVVAARISGYGPEYSIKFGCPSCNVELRHTFDLLEKISASEEDLSSEVELDENSLFSITLPKTNWTLKCRALNGQDEKKIVEATVSNKKEKDFTTTQQMKMVVVSINDVRDATIISQAIEAMPAGDSKYFRKEYERIIPPFSMKHNFKCSNCEHQEVVEVPLTQEFFWFK